MFTSSIIAILTISRAIIQSCIGGSGWFAKGTELSWISNYCISLIENINFQIKNIYFQIGPVLFDKKIFKFLTMQI